MAERKEDALAPASDYVLSELPSGDHTYQIGDASLTSYERSENAIFGRLDMNAEAALAVQTFATEATKQEAQRTQQSVQLTRRTYVSAVVLLGGIVTMGLVPTIATQVSVMVVGVLGITNAPALVDSIKGRLGAPTGDEAPKT